MITDGKRFFSDKFILICLNLFKFIYNMKQLIILLTFLMSNASFAEKITVRLKISNTEVIFNNQVNSGSPVEIELLSNGKSQEVEIYSNNEIRITGKFDVSTHEKVRRSNLKKSSIDVEAVYVFYYKNEVRKIPTKQIFYLTDDSKFDVNQKAYFKNGIKNIPLELKFTCMLE